MINDGIFKRILMKRRLIIEYGWTGLIEFKQYLVSFVGSYLGFLFRKDLIESNSVFNCNVCSSKSFLLLEAWELFVYCEHINSAHKIGVISFAEWDVLNGMTQYSEINWNKVIELSKETRRTESNDELKNWINVGEVDSNK